MYCPASNASHVSSNVPPSAVATPHCETTGTGGPRSNRTSPPPPINQPAPPDSPSHIPLTPHPPPSPPHPRPPPPPAGPDQTDRPPAPPSPGAPPATAHPTSGSRHTLTHLTPTPARPPARSPPPPARTRSGSGASPYAQPAPASGRQSASPPHR